ncbi:MAG: [citrate (pro-3S)-lyase] ligase [Propionibacteriaceae bacterium]
MVDDVILTTVIPAADPAIKSKIVELLADNGLGFDEDISIMVVALKQSTGAVVGCLGLAGGILKCAAIDPSMQGQDLIPRLMEEMNYVALNRGKKHLFLFTKPGNRQAFEACGFTAIAEVPELVVLMENTRQGITRYAAELATQRVEGRTIAGIVVNANPFTYGHEHLIRTAAQECDVVHVFVVKEDASLFPTAERLALVEAGVARLPEADKIIVHPGSDYIVSRATFPSYFLKDKAAIVAGATGLDLQLFRRYIAPALGINTRYVGTEPKSAITNLYNEEMRYWLTTAELSEPPLEVRVVGRKRGRPDSRTRGRSANHWVGDVISATDVRRHLVAGNIAALESLVPPTTIELIKAKYVGDNAPDAARAQLSRDL